MDEERGDQVRVDVGDFERRGLFACAVEREAQQQL
jgi:hypothetical protein